MSLRHPACKAISAKRLLNHLVSPEGDLTATVRSYRQAASPHIPADTALILDLTDLAKPRGRKMQYLDLVHDGSEKQLVKGYWGIEVYAYLNDKRVMPLAMEVYGKGRVGVIDHAHRAWP